MNAAATLPLSPLQGVAEVRALRWVAGLVCASLLAGGFWAAGQQATHPPSTLSVSGLGRHLQPSEIQRVLADALEGPVSALDLRDLRARVLTLPWVAEARVERLWPSGLHVVVREREPLARWGTDSLLDRDGVIFKPRPSEISTELPQLDGPVDQAEEVLQRFHGLREALRDTGLTLTGLSLDVRGEWVGRLAPSIPVRFGRVDPMGKVAVLGGPVRRVMTGRKSEVERIDLRYTNGFAVRWRTGDETEGGR